MSRKIMNKIVVGLIWITILMLLVFPILIFIMFWNQFDIIKHLLILFLILPMLIFAFFLFTFVTKYKKETLLNDIERKKKWKFLSKSYRKFYKKLIIFQFILFIFLIIAGVFLLFDKNSDKIFGILAIFNGVVLFLGTLKSLKELKRMETQ